MVGIGFDRAGEKVQVLRAHRCVRNPVNVDMGPAFGNASSQGHEARHAIDGHRGTRVARSATTRPGRLGSGWTVQVRKLWPLIMLVVA